MLQEELLGQLGQLKVEAAEFIAALQVQRL
jgi:hypothetical protein